jgi:cytosine/adenosine deaminase-related metal-dependent hydrolase
MPKSQLPGQPDSPRDEHRRSSRRGFIAGGIALAAGAVATQLLPQAPTPDRQAADTARALTEAHDTGRPILLQGGILYTVNWQTGDFERGDVLIQSQKISGFGRNLEAPKSALVVNAAGLIVMPGFVDTHHHQTESILRGILADGLYRTGAGTPKNSYASIIETRFRPIYTPDDARIAELLASLSQLNDGVTTSVDTSIAHYSPEHTDACIAGIRAAGRRTVFVYAPSGNNAEQRFPAELTRLRKQYFASGDQLLTLAAAGETPEQWKFARTLNVPIIFHVTGGPGSNLNPFSAAGLMEPDCVYIHCTNLSDELWDRIRDTGGRVSISPATEMSMQQGTPAIQQTLDRALGPSLGSDVECSMTADMFTLMRSALTLQHGLANQRNVTGTAPIRLVTCREVIEFATVYGASVAQLYPKIGQLQVGKEADIILLTTDRLNTFPLNNVPGAITTLMGPGNVDGVFVAGKVRKWGGQLIGVDIARLKTDVERSCDGLLDRANYPRDLFGSCCVEIPGLNAPRA